MSVIVAGFEGEEDAEVSVNLSMGGRGGGIRGQGEGLLSGMTDPEVEPAGQFNLELGRHGHLRLEEPDLCWLNMGAAGGTAGTEKEW